MSAVYRIESLSDLVKIPPDRLDRFLRDLHYSIEMHHLTHGTGSESVQFGPMEWVDDDNHSVTVSGPDGEVILSLVVDDAQDKVTP